MEFVDKLEAPKPSHLQIGDMHPYTELLPLLLTQVLVCYAGKERSPRLAKAFNDAGVLTASFENGTKNLGVLPVEKIKKIFPPKTMVRIIYEEGSKQEEYDSYRKAVDKLKAAKIPYQTNNMLYFGATLKELGVNMFDYF